MSNVTVIGAGLAGCEAAWQLAKRGHKVKLVEMKPQKKSPAHRADTFAELVCSNSLRSNALENAVGLLKEEMRRLSSLVISAADKTSVEAGGALAVDRQAFSEEITKAIRENENIEVEEREVTSLPDERPLIVATGPLTTEPLSESIKEYFGGAPYLSFFDAAAPIVTAESIDTDIAYFKSRYDKGTADYINCPMSEEEYFAFLEALCTAEEAEVHEFEDAKVFEGCMPVEVMARRGKDTLRFGPLKPMGLEDPRTGRRPYAVVQLRKDNKAGTLYNIVGFQTHLKFGQQKRVFSMIPGLGNAEFVRYGVMHRNTYIKSPGLLDASFSVKNDPGLYFAGQMTGVEGYVESAASGLVAGLSLALRLDGSDAPSFSRKTAIGALSEYISGENYGDFQPMNVNFGIMEPLGEKIRGKKEKNAAIAKRALSIIDEIANKI